MKDKAALYSAPGSASEESALRHWDALGKGNEAAFIAIYDQYVEALYHYGERLTTDKTLIEDCLQDLFAELWLRQKELPEVQTVKFYLFKILKRKINRKRTQRAKFISETATDFDFELTLAPEAENDGWQLASAQRETLLRALNQLTPRQKEIVTLRFYDNFSYEEIAEIMTLSNRSVYNLTYRALAVLRRTIDESTWQQVLLALLFIQ